MVARLGNPRRAVVKTLQARRPDGSIVLVDQVRITGKDPTLTGSIWQNEMSFDVHRLRSGEDVDLYDDGTAWVRQTNETLRLI